MFLEQRFPMAQNLQGDDALRTRGPHKTSGSPGGTENGRADVPEDLSEVMDFSKYDLGTTMRLVVLSGESRRIEVKRGSRHGSIFIKDGEIYRVETSERQGDEALFDILSWDKTVHSDVRQVEPVEPNVRIATTVLLNLMKNRP